MNGRIYAERVILDCYQIEIRWRRRKMSEMHFVQVQAREAGSFSLLVRVLWLTLTYLRLTLYRYCAFEVQQLGTTSGT